MNKTFRTQLNRFQLTAMAWRWASSAWHCAAVGARESTARFHASYLFAYLFWLGLALGCFGVAMIHHLTGGRWGQPTRRFLESGFYDLALDGAALHSGRFRRALFLSVGADPLKSPRTRCCNIAPLIHESDWMFIARAILFSLVWIIMAVCLRKWSLEQDQTERRHLPPKSCGRSAGPA